MVHLINHGITRKTRRAPSEAGRSWRGGSPREERPNQPLLPSVALEKEASEEKEERNQILEETRKKHEPGKKDRKERVNKSEFEPNNSGEAYTGNYMGHRADRNARSQISLDNFEKSVGE